MEYIFDSWFLNIIQCCGFSEFINKVQFELTQDPTIGATAGPSKCFTALEEYPSTSLADWDFITQLFQGQLVSEVCYKIKKIS